MESGYVRMDKFSNYDIECSNYNNINNTYYEYIYSKYVENKMNESELSLFINNFIENDYIINVHGNFRICRYIGDMTTKQYINMIYENIVIDNISLLTQKSHTYLLTLYIFSRKIKTSLLWNYSDDEVFSLDTNLFINSIIEVLFNGFYEEYNNKILYVANDAVKFYNIIEINKNTINKDDNNKSFNILMEWLLSSKLSLKFKQMICDYLNDSSCIDKSTHSTFYIKNYASICECLYNTKKCDEHVTKIKLCKKYFNNIGIFIRDFYSKYYEKIDNIINIKCKYEYNHDICDRWIDDYVKNIRIKIKDNYDDITTRFNNFKNMYDKINKNNIKDRHQTHYGKERMMKKKERSSSRDKKDKSRSHSKKKQPYQNKKKIEVETVDLDDEKYKIKSELYKKISEAYNDTCSLISTKYISKNGFEYDKIKSNVNFLCSITDIAD
jgi:hypothetical protein